MRLARNPAGGLEQALDRALNPAGGLEQALDRSPHLGSSFIAMRSAFSKPGLGDWIKLPTWLQIRLGFRSMSVALLLDFLNQGPSRFSIPNAMPSQPNRRLRCRCVCGTLNVFYG